MDRETPNLRIIARDEPLHPKHLKRTAFIQTLRLRLFEVPARITRGQRKTWLHLPAG